MGFQLALEPAPLMRPPLSMAADPRDFRRRFNLIRKIAIAWGCLVVAAAVAAFAGSIYMIANPQVIGSYLGQIAAGFEAVN